MILDYSDYQVQVISHQDDYWCYWNEIWFLFRDNVWSYFPEDKEEIPVSVLEAAGVVMPIGNQRFQESEIFLSEVRAK